MIQFDPPRSISEFTNPVNPIPGRSVIFLQPTETGLVEKVSVTGASMEEFAFPRKQLLKVQSIIEKTVAKNYNLHVLAKDGFRLVHSPNLFPVGYVPAYFYPPSIMMRIFLVRVYEAA